MEKESENKRINENIPSSKSNPEWENAFNKSNWENGKIKYRTRFHSIIQSNVRNQFTLNLPLTFVNVLRIEKGHIFTFQINEENGDYSIKYNPEMSKISIEESKKKDNKRIPLDKFIGRWLPSDYERNPENNEEIKKIPRLINQNSIFIFNTKVQESNRRFTIAFPKIFIEFSRIKKGDGFIFELNPKDNGEYDSSIRHDKEATEFYEMSEEDKTSKVWEKLMKIDFLDRAILETMTNLIWGVNATEIANKLNIHPATVKNRLIKLVEKNLVFKEIVGERLIYKLNKEKYKELILDNKPS